MSYQTFYIDPDEEITSIVSRLSKAQAPGLILIVPQRALILASLINLKLLSREAQKLQKNIIIVTQDEAGLAAAQKAGIEARPSFNGLPVSEKAETFKPMNQKIAPNKPSKGMTLDRGGDRIQPKATSSHVRVRDVHRPKMDMTRRPDRTRRISQSARNIPVKTSTENNIITPRPQPEPQEHHRIPEAKWITSYPEAKPEKRSHSEYARNNSHDNLDGQLESFFGKNDNAPVTGQPKMPKKKKMRPAKDSANQLPKVTVSNKLRIAIAGFFVGAILLIGGLLAYFFFPQAEVTVTPEGTSVTRDFTFDLSSEGSVMNNKAVSLIPIQLVSKEQEGEKVFEATGEMVANTLRASGTVKIFNEYSDEDQPLVATTRLLTDDGKLYRLTESVVVPGMVGDEPGVIEASVRADQAGSEYNIDPTTFTIPGFKGGPKYEAFYAKSGQSFVGGGASGEKVTVVSQEDVDMARESLLDELRATTLSEMQAALASDMKALEEAVQVEVVNEIATPSVGTATSEFNYRATILVQALFFDEEAVRSDIINVLDGEVVQDGDLAWTFDDVRLEYGKISANFEEKELQLKVHAIGTFEAMIDTQMFRKDLVGKDMEELQVMLEQRPEIQKLDIEFTPSFFSHSVPLFESRIDVRVNAGGDSS